jgi:CelD/BcsL family acetyltransferase involved in cellulose biosynthesis
VVALFAGRELAGVTSFMKRRWSWEGRLGYWRVARFPVQLVDLCGEELLAPDDPKAQEALLIAVDEAARPHLVFLESVRLHSPLWRLLRSSVEIRRRFWVYLPNGITPRRIVELSGSFDDYLAKFSSRTRANFRNKIKKLERACGELRLWRVTRREELASFLDQVSLLSRRSWQGRRLGQLVGATDEDRERLALCADQGWLRSYLLSAAEQPLSFAIGYQASGTYFYARPGYDPAFGHLRVGTVLLYKILEDLTGFDAARRLDFGYGDNEYKAIFANHTHEEANVYLVRRSPYMGVALATVKGLSGLAAGVRWGLDRLRLREVVRRRLRGARPPAGRPSTGEPDSRGRDHQPN